ncbi:unnamed protein product [Chrysoparadoxa australica]
MKSVDYRVPWGRTGDTIITAKRDLDDFITHNMKLSTVRSSLDNSRPYCSTLQHLQTRPKKRQMAEDRQRQIHSDNQILMQRLTKVLKQRPAAGPVRYQHLTPEYRESLRRKGLLKLNEANKRVAKAIKSQKPFYDAAAMQKDERERQVVLKLLSRAQRRKDIMAACSKSACIQSSSSKLTGLASSCSAHGSSKTAPCRTSYSAQDMAVFKEVPEGGTLLRTAKHLQGQVAMIQGFDSTRVTQGGAAHRPRIDNALPGWPLQFAPPNSAVVVVGAKRAGTMEDINVQGAQHSMLFTPGIRVSVDELRREPLLLCEPSANRKSPG